MNKFKKSLALVLSGIMMTSALPMTALATPSVGSTADDSSVGQDTIQGQYTEYTEVKESTESEVYLTVDDSDLIVSLPTTVILDGTPNDSGQYIGKYSVGVKGDMSGDKIVTVEPDTSVVSLRQDGKVNSDATISQTQTDFDTDDFRDETVTDGTITATALTAGSWNSQFNFNINVNKINHYYSTLNLAFDDINNETFNTESTVADLYTAEGAACGVYKIGGTYRVEVIKDITDQSALAINKPVKINLNNHTVSFAEGAYITSTNDFTAIDGEMIGINAPYVLYAPSGNNLTVNNADIKLTADSVNSTNNLAIFTQALNNNVDNCSFNVSNESSKGVGAFISTNINAINRINDSTFNTVSISGKSISVQVSGNTNCNDIKIFSKSNTGDVSGLYYNGKNVIINGAVIYADGNKQTAKGSGISMSSSANGNITINSTTEHPVNIFGEQWGISNNGKVSININGGIYTSNAHALYLKNNSTIKSAKICCTGNEAGTVYLGGANADENAIINFENCIIGNPEATEQKGLYSFVSTRNKVGYQTVKEVNITDCDIYQPVNNMFGYHNAYKDGVNLNQTKFNLRGNTKLYEKYDTDLNKWVEYSREDVTNYINPSWKTTLNGSTVGNKLVWSPNSVVTDGAIVTNNMTEEANVYDYRNIS